MNEKTVTLILIFCMIGILFLNYELEVNSHINHDKTPNHQININNTTVKYEASGYCYMWLMATLWMLMELVGYGLLV